MTDIPSLSSREADAKAESGVTNRLRAVRTRLGKSQQDLASAAGVARQTIGGIEAGTYSLSLSVALRLARALGCTVEELFWLKDDAATVEAVPVRCEEDITNPVALVPVAGRWIAHSLSGEAAFRNEMVPADGIGEWTTEGKALSVRLLDDPLTLNRTVAVAGCSPGISLWTRSAERWHPGLRVHWFHANSEAALSSLGRGEVHAAGLHLYDPATGESNTPFVRQMLPRRRVILVNLGIGEEGLVVASGNPRHLHTAPDLARPGVRLINREPGAGARRLLDNLLAAGGVDTAEVDGYDRLVPTHQAVAQAVLAGEADAGVSTASVAAAFGLDFVPMQRVRYDLAILREYRDHDPLRQLLETLEHRWVRSQLSVLGGYDTSRTGEIVAET